MKLNFGCGEFYVADWLNVDLVHEGRITPDLVIEPGLAGIGPATTLAKKAPFERVFLGHVLEHVPWDDVVPLLTRLAELTVSGGELLVVGPDIYKVLDEWKAGTKTVNFVTQCLEDHRHFQPAENIGPGARHYWNCYEQRVVEALEAVPFLTEVTPYADIDKLPNEGWPLVASVGWQCGVKATVR